MALLVTELGTLWKSLSGATEGFLCFCCESCPDRDSLRAVLGNLDVLELLDVLEEPWGSTSAVGVTLDVLVVLGELDILVEVDTSEADFWAGATARRSRKVTDMAQSFMASRGTPFDQW